MCTWVVIYSTNYNYQSFSCALISFFFLFFNSCCVVGSMLGAGGVGKKCSVSLFTRGDIERFILDCFCHFFSVPPLLPLNDPPCALSFPPQPRCGEGGRWLGKGCNVASCRDMKGFVYLLTAVEYCKYMYKSFGGFQKR